jgi:hypothetical protein
VKLASAACGGESPTIALAPALEVADKSSMVWSDM